MRRRITGAVLGGLVIALAPFTSAANAAPATAPAAAVHASHASCADAKPGFASCKALVRNDVAKSAKSLRADADAPDGLGPADLQDAYKLKSSSTEAADGQTVAIVDANDDPTAEEDLATYRKQFGLPECTTDNGCFKKVDQTGGSKYPAPDPGWAQEISLDLDMVSATCPSCKIVLVEGDSASFEDLGTAVNTASTLAGVVSNSYGGDDAADSDYGKYYNHKGVIQTVSSGDNGYGVEYPASSQYVLAVGGTSLKKSSSDDRGWTESAWDGAGSGCSTLNEAIPGQKDAKTGCDKRAVADVSAVADPATGVAVYDSTAADGQKGWMVFGGTSVAAPVVAGVIGLAGNASTIDNNYPYAHADKLFDVTTGGNGTCDTKQWCNAGTGWDGPTGLGTPNGTDAF